MCDNTSSKENINNNLDQVQFTTPKLLSKNIACKNNTNINSNDNLDNDRIKKKRTPRVRVKHVASRYATPKSTIKSDKSHVRGRSPTTRSIGIRHTPKQRASSTQRLRSSKTVNSINSKKNKIKRGLSPSIRLRETQKPPGVSSNMPSTIMKKNDVRKLMRSSKMNNKNSILNNKVVVNANKGQSNSSVNMIMARSVSTNSMNELSSNESSKSTSTTSKRSPSPLKLKSSANNEQDTNSLKHEIKVLQNNLLQWCVINARAKETAEERSKQARSEVFNVWNQINKRKQDILQLRIQQTNQHYKEAMQALVLPQNERLAKIFIQLDKFQKHHHILFKALYVAMHRMTIDKGVKFDVEKFIEQIKKSEKILKQIQNHVQDFIVPTENLSSSVQSLNELVHHEFKELKNCKEMLLAFHALENMEQSLIIHQYQLIKRN